MVISDLSGGGTERVFASLLHHLDRDRFEIHLCVWRPVYAYDLPDDIPVTVIQKTRPWHLFRVIHQTQRLIDDWQPDVIFSAMYYTNILTGMACRRTRCNPRWICRLGSPAHRDMKGLKYILARYAYQSAAIVMGNHPAVSRSAVEYLKIPSSKVKTIQNPVDIEQIRSQSQTPLPFTRDTAKKIFIHAGRFSAEKRQDLLLRAFAGLSAPQAELWMLGQGAEAERLKALATELGITDRLRWLGFQPHPYPYFKAADCFMLSSAWEGMPNVLLESIACGTPVISTDCFAEAESFIGETGLLVPVDNEKTMCQAMQQIYEDETNLQRFTDACRDYDFSPYAPAEITKQYEDIFDS